MPVSMSLKRFQVAVMQNHAGVRREVNKYIYIYVTHKMCTVLQKMTNSCTEVVTCDGPSPGGASA